MPIPLQEIIDAFQLVAEEEEIQVCVKEAVKGAAWAGGMSVLGALVGGPVGMAAGGALGTLVGYSTSKDFRPLHQIIKDMSEKDKARLVDHMQSVMVKHKITTTVALAALVEARGSAPFNEFVKALRSFTV